MRWRARRDISSNPLTRPSGPTIALDNAAVKSPSVGPLELEKLTGTATMVVTISIVSAGPAILSIDPLS